jgi:hypothetical protein
LGFFMMMGRSPRGPAWMTWLWAKMEMG